MNRMKLAFEKELNQTGLIRPRDKLLIACSGGSDSVALAHLIREVSLAWKLKPVLIHFHHGLRGVQADRDARFVKRLARDFGWPFYLGRGHVRREAALADESIEEAARRLRYDFFVRTAKRLRIFKVLLAHHLEDQAETVLMRVIQGTGIKGLCGIRKTMTVDKTVFYRPLLDFSKKELLEFLCSIRAQFCTDASNHSTQFLRNKIRRKLFPILRRHFNRNVVAAAARIPAIVSADAEVLDDAEQKAWQKLRVKKRGRQLVLSRRKFLDLKSGLRFRILNRALKEMDTKSGLSYDIWQNLQPQFAKKRTRVSLPRNIDLWIEAAQIILKKRVFQPRLPRVRRKRAKPSGLRQ